MNDPFPIGEFFRQYGGWAALLVYFLLERLWPWFSGSFFPQKLAMQQAYEERNIAAYEQLAKTMNEMVVVLTAMSERMNHFDTALNEHSKASEAHHRTTAEGMATMYERTAHGGAPTKRGKSGSRGMERET